VANRLITQIVLMLAVSTLCGACAATLSTTRQVEIVQGKQITYIAASMQNKAGSQFVCMDRYGPDGTLIAHDVSTNVGLLQTVLPGLATSTIQAGAAIEAAGLK
jgi:hypothetical protein